MQLGTVALPLRPIGDEEPPDGPGHHESHFPGLISQGLAAPFRGQARALE
jgi:hypothetical protein